MKGQSHQIKLSQNLFWDTDFNRLDFEKNKEFIISRVLLYGDAADFKKIKDFYGLPKIIKTARNLKYLDKKSLNFFSLIFNLPKNKFRCFKELSTKKQNLLWNR